MNSEWRVDGQTKRAFGQISERRHHAQKLIRELCSYRESLQSNIEKKSLKKYGDVKFWVIERQSSVMEELERRHLKDRVMESLTERISSQIIACLYVLIEGKIKKNERFYRDKVIE